MRLSVAIVTRNRPQSLERAIASWRRQAAQPWEILVSDDSDDSLREQVAGIASRHGCRYVAGPRRGLYANRNHAALACKGSHLLSGDDDHEHPAGLVERVLAAIQEDARMVWCIGEFDSWEDHDLGRNFHPPGQLNAHGSIQPAPDAPGWAIADGATVYPREIFDSGARMYEGIRFGASYCEFGCLLHRLGWPTRPLSGASIIHHGAQGPRSFEEPAELASSELFAALMLSFYYQPSLRNRMTSLTKVPLKAWRYRHSAYPVVATALRQYRERTAQVAALVATRAASVPA